MNEMSDQLRGFLFVVLVLFVILLWSRVYSPPVPPPRKTAQTASGTAAPQASTAKAAGEKAAVEAAPAKPVKIEAAGASEEKIVAVDSLLYHVELSNRGGVVRSWKLKKYMNDQTPPRPLELVDPNVSQQLGWPFSLLLSDKQLEDEANSALYEMSPPAGNITAPAEVAFHWSDGHLDVTKKFTFAQDYQMSAEVSASLDGKPLPVAVAWRGGFGDRSVYKASQSVSVFYNAGGKLTLLQYKKLGVSGNQSQPFQQAGPMEFVGIEDQFFAAAFIPQAVDLDLWHWTQDHKIVADG